MNVTLSYLGRSSLTTTLRGVALSLAPNLRRDRVSYTGALTQPLRFREAVSALHDVVVCDLRWQPKDHSDYHAFLKREKEREASMRSGAAAVTRADFRAEKAGEIPPDFEATYNRLRKQYWGARSKYSSHLLRHDPELWRMLVPCDPVITVAPDVLFFECFSKDESSYGCLTVERDAFRDEDNVALGTTNIDYSWALYEQFQKLRSYRETRFQIDPTGFEVKTESLPDYREEKIELPPSWLRGFLQVQAAMSLPLRRVVVSREALYSVLAWLKRHRAKKSPRALRFERVPGRPIALVLEPWEKRIELHGSLYTGPEAETIRIWGRDRLHVLARLLPLAERIEVFLLGTGLPSFWSVRMGEMRLLLGLSGWTANDWTGGSALDQLAPPAEPSAELLGDMAAVFRESPTRTFEEVRLRIGAAPALVAAGLNRLALLGQLIHDLDADVYRWRQVMPVALSLEQIVLDSPETGAARDLYEHGRLRVERDEVIASGLRVVAGRVGDRPAEAVLDGDGRLVRGKCTCSHHFQFKLRRGPCRHLQVLRRAAQEGVRPKPTLESWFRRLWH